MFITYPCIVSGSPLLSSNRRYPSSPFLDELITWKAEKTKPRLLANVITTTNDNAVIHHAAYRQDTKIYCLRAYPTIESFPPVGVV